MAAFSINYGQIHAIRDIVDRSTSVRKVQSVKLMCGPKVDYDAESESRFHIINGEAVVNCLACQSKMEIETGEVGTDK